MLRKALALVITLASCGDAGDLPLVIMGPLAPPTPESSVCLFEANANGPFLSKGLMDSTLTTEYSGVLLLGNTSLVGAPARIDIEAILIVDTTTVIDTESDGTTELVRFTEDLSGMVQPPSGGSPGLGTVTVKLASSRALQNLAGTRILAHVKVGGRLANGTRTESGFVTFPIDVCTGCLATCRGDACFVGQDQPVCP